MQIKNRFTLVIMAGLLIFSSCKKDKGNNEPVVVSADDKLKDSVLMYTRDIYLWYKQIPADFNPRKYADPNAIMDAIRTYSMEPPNARPVDRFSFASKKVDWDNRSSGISQDFGFSIFFLNNTDLRVKFVERASPSGLAGIQRGWRIVKINGSTNINTDQATINTIVAAVFESSSTAFTFQKPDGSNVDITLKAATYQTHPVMVDSTYTVSGKKIGYLVLNSFLGDLPAINAELSRVFTRFANYGVTDVVVDLRYNGGGYVSLAEKLSNYLAPSSATGSLMMKQQYNDKYSKYDVSYNFNKLGTLELTRVFFIVSSSSASASELVINNLKPVLDVKLIGRNDTYGKPVGFFAIPVGDWYIFPVSSKTVNRNGESNYYNGFSPEAKVADGIDKNWGDVTETSLASAIKYITTGGFRLLPGAEYVEIPEVTVGNHKLDKQAFKGAVLPTKSLK